MVEKGETNDLGPGKFHDGFQRLSSYTKGKVCD